MVYQIENHMVVDSARDCLRSNKALLVCDYCEERIVQSKALRILLKKHRVWICDRCIEDLKEFTGYED